jgi:hypothetical protein
MKICPVAGTELFHAEGRTDIMKVVVAFFLFFRKYLAPKNGWHACALQHYISQAINLFIDTYFLAYKIC